MAALATERYVALALGRFRAAILWSNFIDWQAKAHLGDLASILGVLLSAIGFAITIVGVFASREAARRAERAAKSAILRIRVLDEMMSFTFALQTLDEIKRFHRVGQWALLPDRYAALRRTLISIKSSSLDLTPTQWETVQNTLTSLKLIEEAVERGLAAQSTLDGAGFNILLARSADGLAETLYELKLLHTDVRDGKA